MFVLVAVTHSCGTVALQTGLSRQGTVCVCALETLGLFWPKWFFGDASIAQTSHVIVCQRTTVCFTVSWVCVVKWWGGNECYLMSVHQNKALSPPFHFLKSFELSFNPLPENKLWIWGKGWNNLSFISCVALLTLLADEESCCPGNTAIWRVLLHNLSGQLYSNLLVLGGAWRGKRLALRQHCFQ